MVEELSTSKFTNYASVVISTAETIFQYEQTVSDLLVNSIGHQSYVWLTDAKRQREYRNEIQPHLPPDGKYYDSRNLVDALEFTQEGLSDVRQQAYAVVAASLWGNVFGTCLTSGECDYVAKTYRDAVEIQNFVTNLAKLIGERLQVKERHYLSISLEDSPTLNWFEGSLLFVAMSNPKAMCLYLS